MYVVVTGASRGVGKALAYEYASHKFNLVLTCKNNIDLLKSIKLDIENKYNVKVLIHKGNLYDDDAKEIIDNIKNDVYILINNQGVADYNLLQDIDKKTYDELIDTNITNPIFTTKILLDGFIHRKDGVIVNISSIWGQIGASNESIYSVTKGALDSFTKSMAKELKDSDISVISFSLGMVDTDMNSHFTDEDLSSIIDKLDDKKMFDAKYIATTIYDTVSTHHYNTGDIIEIDNGLKNL